MTVWGDRSEHPYVQAVIWASEFMCATAYMSLRAKCPPITVLQRVRDENNNIIGYTGAEFDLRDLPFNP